MLCMWDRSRPVSEEKLKVFGLIFTMKHQPERHRQTVQVHSSVHVGGILSHLFSIHLLSPSHSQFILSIITDA